MLLIWDILIVAIIAGFALASYRRGFLTAVVRLAGSLGCLALGLTYSGPAARYLYACYMKDGIVERVADSLGQAGASELEAFSAALGRLAEQLPAALSGAFNAPTAERIERWYQEFSAAESQGAAEALAGAVIEPLAVNLVQVVVFCVMFAAGMLVVNLLAGLLRGVNFIPLVGGVNALLGGVLGALEGTLYVFVGAALLWLLLTAAGGELPFLTFEGVEQTALLRRFFEAGPWTAGAMRLV